MPRTLRESSFEHDEHALLAHVVDVHEVSNRRANHFFGQIGQVKGGKLESSEEAVECTAGRYRKRRLCEV